MSDKTGRVKKRVAILGVRGVPAAHGGFETFAERLAPYLAESGWEVAVYCQEAERSEAAAPGASVWKSSWQGVTRVHLAVGADTAVNSIVFDWRCISHVLTERPDVVLILGYNTAVFAMRLRLAGIPSVFNMDGMEWQRAKWSLPAKCWLYANERAGCLLANHLIADHPHIARHLQSRVPSNKITIIPYGADSPEPSDDSARLHELGVRSKGFATLIARAEPENSILDIVRAFSAKPRGIHLLVLGTYYPDRVRYHADVLAAASDEVRFLGAIYDPAVVKVLRRHSVFYVHGHQVGGSNPSLLEAMGAGNAVLAHDNRFNRWVAGDGARYFADATSFEDALGDLMNRPGQLEQLGDANRRRALDVFSWTAVLQSYSELLTDVVLREAADPHTGWGRRPCWGL